MREHYAGEVTFVVRYFPLPAHPNSETAAVAVEAAARQAELEAMYQRMYETQEEWSHQQQSQAPVFRGYADDLKDGLELGVSGTPTFFVAGEQVQPATVEEFYAAVDEALAAG